MYVQYWNNVVPCCLPIPKKSYLRAMKPTVTYPPSTPRSDLEEVKCGPRFQGVWKSVCMLRGDPVWMAKKEIQICSRRQSPFRRLFRQLVLYHCQTTTTFTTSGRIARKWSSCWSWLWHFFQCFTYLPYFQHSFATPKISLQKEAGFACAYL